MTMSTRDAYGHVLETEIYKNPDVVVVDADIASSTRAEKFKNKAPERRLIRAVHGTGTGNHPQLDLSAQSQRKDHRQPRWPDHWQ